MRQELAAAQRAGHIVPRIDACASAVARLADCTRERTVAEGEASSKADVVNTAEQRAARATADAEPCADIARQIRALDDEIKGDLARRAVLMGELDGYGRSVPVARSRAADARARADRARAATDAAHAARENARVLLGASGFDATVQHQVEELWTTVVQVRAADAELARLADTRQQHQAAFQRAQRLAASRDTALALATDAAATASAAERAAATALEQGQARFQAVVVRGQLHAGDACPVCLQTVVLMPPQEPVPELEALTAAREQARAHAGEAQRALRVAAEARAAASAGVDSERHALDAASATFDQKTTERRVLGSRIRRGAHRRNRRGTGHGCVRGGRGAAHGVARRQGVARPRSRGAEGGGSRRRRR